MFDLPSPPLVMLIVLLVVGVTYVHRQTRRSSLPFPPGPPGDPILGHVRMIPAENSEDTFARWSKEYKSDILYLHVLGRPIIVLNSAQVAVDLIVKRGVKYADRPHFAIYEAMGWGDLVGFLPLGKHFNVRRAVLQKNLRKSNLGQYRPMQEQHTRVLLADLLRAPANWDELLRKYAMVVIMGIGIGSEITGDDDPFVQMSKDASYTLVNGGAPGSSIVDFFPFVRHLPSWLVPDRALKFARDWRWAVDKVHELPLQWVQRDIENGTSRPSLVREMLFERESAKKSGEGFEYSMDDIKTSAATVLIAGLDTVWSSLQFFVLALTLHPEVQTKDQAVIDEVIGSDRLPTFEDRSKLPYIEYVVHETLRWMPAAPLGMPHRVVGEDEYNGMRIPAGATVIVNAKAITRDERIYADPDAFNPDRYIPRVEGGRGEPFPIGQFGFGRRVCVGAHVADANLWIAIAGILATMRIEKEVGTDGKEIIPEIETVSGVSSHPKTFPCRIVPRSAAAEKLIARLSLERRREGESQ